MRSMKRVLSLLLVLCMIFTMMPSIAMAAEGDATQVATFGSTTYGVVEIADGKYQVTTDSVADTAASYDTAALATEAAFGAAMAAWKTAKSGTVTLCSDITLTKVIGGVGSTTEDSEAVIQVDAGETLTLNLVGFNITLDAALGSYEFINVAGSGTLTVNGNGGAITGADTVKTHASGYVFRTLTDFTGTVAFNKINVARYGSGSYLMWYDGAGVITFNGGTWNGGNVFTNNGTSTLYVTGGFTIITPTSGYAFSTTEGGHVYIDDAVFYTGDSTRKTAETGYGMVCRRSNGSTVYTDVPLTLAADANGTNTALCEIGTAQSCTVYYQTDALSKRAHTVTPCEATFWTGVAADEKVYCATLREALNLLNANSRTRTGSEVITLLQDVDIANRADGVYFPDTKGTSATYAIYVDNGGFTLDLGGHTIRTSAGFMQNYKDQTAYSALPEAAKTMTVKNGTVMTSVQGIGTQDASDKAGRSMVNHWAGNLVMENIKYLGQTANAIIMNGTEGYVGTLTVDGCEIFTNNSTASNRVIGGASGNTYVVKDSKLGSVAGIIVEPAAEISGDTVLYYGTNADDVACKNEPTLPTGYEGKTGTGSYTTSTGLTMTNVNTWTLAEAATGTKAAGFTAEGGTEVVYRYDATLAADNTANNVYTSAEKALAAALAAWETAGKGTVNVYADVDITGNVTFPGDTSSALAAVNKDHSLTLTVANGVKITGNTVATSVLFIDDNAQVTVNGGNFVFSQAPVFIVSNDTDLNFTGSVTFDDVEATVTNAKNFVVNSGLAGTITFNGGDIVVYNVPTTGTDAGKIKGSGFACTLGAKAAGASATNYVLTGGVKLFTMQYYALRIGMDAKVYADKCVVTSQYQSSESAAPGKYIAACWDTTGTTQYAATGDNVFLYPMGDSTKVSDNNTVTNTGSFQPDGAIESKKTTVVTVTPKIDPVASYTVNSNTTEYETFLGAMEAMYTTPGGTVKLLKNVQYDVTAGQNHASTAAYAFDFTAADNVTAFTLDLNGCRLDIQEGGFRFYHPAAVKIVSSAAMGTLICGTRTADTTKTRTGISFESGVAGATLTLDNVAMYATGSAVRQGSSDANTVTVKDSVVYSPSTAVNVNGSAVTLENAIVASREGAISANTLTADADSAAYHPADKSACNVTPTGLTANAVTGQTFAASTYFAGLTDLTGVTKTTWGSEQLPAGTVASFTDATGATTYYGIRETSGTYELTVDGVVDATTYTASYTDKEEAMGYAFGLALKASYAVRNVGTITLYNDVTLNISQTGGMGGHYGANGSTGSALLALGDGADFVLNLNGHTLTGENIDNTSATTKLAYNTCGTGTNCMTVNGGMDGVEGTDYNGNTIVGGGAGKIVWNDVLCWFYPGKNVIHFNGVHLVHPRTDFQFAVQLRKGVRSGSINFNGGHFDGVQLTNVQSNDSTTTHEGSNTVINVTNGFTADCNAVYAFRLGVTTDVLNIYDATITINKSTADVANYATANYIFRYWATGSNVSPAAEPLANLEANNVTHTAVLDTANSNVIHTFKRGEAVATYKANETAEAVTCYTWNDAVAMVEENMGGTVTLLRNTTVVGDYDGGKKWVSKFSYGFTLDLGGCTLRLEDAHGLQLYAGGTGKTVIKNGTILCDTESNGVFKDGGGYSAIYAYDGIDLTVENATIAGPSVGIRLPGNDEKTYKATVTVNNSTIIGLTYGAVVEAKQYEVLTVNVSNSTFATQNIGGIVLNGANGVLNLTGINNFYYPAEGQAATASAGKAVSTKTQPNLNGMSWSAESTRDFDFGYTFTSGTVNKAGNTVEPGKNLLHMQTAYASGYTYTTAAGETTWFSELGAALGNNTDDGTADSVYEALKMDTVGGGTVTFFESVFYGDKTEYGTTTEVTLADGTKEMATVDSRFVDSHAANIAAGQRLNSHYIFNVANKDYTIDLNGHGMFMADEAISDSVSLSGSTTNSSAVLIGLQGGGEKAFDVEVKNGTIVWAGQQRPFCTGTSTENGTAYTLTLTDVNYSNKGSSSKSNEAVYVQDKSTIIVDGGVWKDSGDADTTDADGLICVNINAGKTGKYNADPATIILKGGVELHSCVTYAVTLNGSDDKMIVESDEGATIYQSTKVTDIAALRKGNGTVDIGQLTFIAPKETAAPYKHQVKLVKEVAYHFAPGADTADNANGTGYDTFKAAFEAAKANGGTVKLVKDIDLVDEYALADLPVKLENGTKPITLDLNGLAITTSSNALTSKSLLYLYGDASLAIRNGTFKWAGSTAISIVYDSTNTVAWTGQLELTDVDFSNIYSGKCIGVQSAAGQIIVSGGKMLSRNAPFTINAKYAETTTKITLKDGVTISTYQPYPGTEPYIFRLSETYTETEGVASGFRNNVAVTIEDAVMWSQNPNKGEIMEKKDRFAGNFTLAAGKQFFISETATETTFEYIGYADGRVGNVYMHTVGVPAAEYVKPDGTTTVYPDLYSAVQASNAYGETLASRDINTDLGTVRLISDIVLDEGTPMGTYGFFVNTKGSLVFDLDGHKISTAGGYKLDRTFFILAMCDCNLTVKNGVMDITSDANLMNIGNSTNAPVVNVTFKDMYINVDGGKDMVYSRSSDATVTFDGGFYNVHKDVKDAGFVIRTDKNSAGTATTIRINVKGGAVLESSGWVGYILTFATTKAKQMHIYSGAISSYGGYIYSSSWLESTACLYDADGNEVTVEGTGDAFKSNFMKNFTKVISTPNIYTDPTYGPNPSYNLYCYNMGGSAEQQADSVARSETTGLYYNIDQLVNHLKWLTEAETITALANIDTANTAAAQSGVDVELVAMQDVTLAMNGFSLISDLTGKGAVTVTDGTVDGALSASDVITLKSAMVNSDLACTNGLTATDSTINADVTVTGGEMALENTGINGKVSVTAAGSHSITGGTITTTAPIEVGAGAAVTVSSNAVLDASASNALTGNGAVIFKEAVVKFATTATPYGNVVTEGNYTDSEASGVTTRTYTLLGDTVQGTNVAYLVENERYFATLQEAVNAASRLTGETVQLVADTTESAVTVDRGVNIDMNGFKAVTEITVHVTDKEVCIANGTVATTNGDAITVRDGKLYLSDATVAATGSAVVVNGATAELDVLNSIITGDTDCTDDGSAIDVQAAKSVYISGTELYTGADNKASICVGAAVAYEVVTVESGEIYVPKTYYEANRLWAEGQDKIICLVNSVSRYAYDSTIENPADGTAARKSFYICTATAPAAMIGKVGYATFKEAVAAAKTMSNAEIVLLRDIQLKDEYAGEYDPTVTSNKYLITLNKAMTIDLNGHTIYGVESGKYAIFSISAGATVRIKNGTISNMYPEYVNTSAIGDYTIANNGNVYLDNVDIYAYKLCVNSNTSNATAKFYINGGTFVSQEHFAAFSNYSTAARTNPEWFITGGARFISMASDTSTTYVAAVNARYSGFCIDDAYVYYNASADATTLARALPKDAPYVQLALPEGATLVEQTGHMAVDENGNKIASLLKTYEEVYDGETFTVNYYGIGNVAKVGDTEYATLDAALTAAAADGASNDARLLKDITLSTEATVAAGETLDLNGHKVTFTDSGKLNLSGAMNTNGGTIESDGNVAIAAGASINGYTYGNAVALNTKLNLKAVSLSMNEYVDVNLKFNEADTASFNGVKVMVDGTAVNLYKTGNGLHVYKIENVYAADYATAKWVVMEGNDGNTASVGLPKQVSVVEFARKVVGSTEYGYTSNLGMTMTALMEYAGVDVNTEFPGNSHTNIADFGTAMPTDNGTISVSGDFANGFALKVTSTTAGELDITHKDVYGNEFKQSIPVSDGGTVTYNMIHVADARQTVTIKLMVNGAETSMLETNLASAASGADTAIIVSNLAEKFFTGK